MRIQDENTNDGGNATNKYDTNGREGKKEGERERKKATWEKR